ncbi:hypothetical protein [Sulfuricurvum sp.]|uniref:hypothetical protein n=1 Tax=Sulfuricurvum sp. TaxID=2025608 RepID=UPI00198E4683|nr:hypothetical protein [Sulfuricurvum sp.]MBD3807051.1 hypothetical protein [Sulfuricurvum sp.]
MKKVTLSALAAVMIGGVASADTLTLYTDPKSGQVYTTAGEGRVEMGDFISAKEVDLSQRESESAFAEYKEKMKKYVSVKSKAKTLEFSGTHYFGITSVSPERTGSTSVADSRGFELRRNYVQVKGYFNNKDYFRVTMDTTKGLASSTGYANMYAKYAYLYLNEVLPYTGVEFGIAHRPWIDYEEHNGWHYRSINKVALEQKKAATEHGPDLINSADLGANFKTKTENFSSEIGIFNGEGYHADKAAANQENSGDLSLEWRLTAHLIGSGTKVGKADRTKETYAHISTYGMISKNHKDDWTVLARYDVSDIDKVKNGTGAKSKDQDMKQTLLGVAYKYNKNVSFIASGKHITDTTETKDPATIDKAKEKDVYMFTTEVKW